MEPFLDLVDALLGHSEQALDRGQYNALLTYAEKTFNVHVAKEINWQVDGADDGFWVEGELNRDPIRNLKCWRETIVTPGMVFQSTGSDDYIARVTEVRFRAWGSAASVRVVVLASRVLPVGGEGFMGLDLLEQILRNGHANVIENYEGVEPATTRKLDPEQLRINGGGELMKKCVKCSNYCHPIQVNTENICVSCADTCITCGALTKGTEEYLVDCGLGFVYYPLGHRECGPCMKKRAEEACNDGDENEDEDYDE